MKGSDDAVRPRSWSRRRGPVPVAGRGGGCGVRGMTEYCTEFQKSRRPARPHTRSHVSGDLTRDDKNIWSFPTFASRPSLAREDARGPRRRPRLTLRTPSPPWRPAARCSAPPSRLPARLEVEGQLALRVVRVLERVLAPPAARRLEVVLRRTREEVIRMPSACHQHAISYGAARRLEVVPVRSGRRTCACPRT